MAEEYLCEYVWPYYTSGLKFSPLLSAEPTAENKQPRSEKKKKKAAS